MGMIKSTDQQQIEDLSAALNLARATIQRQGEQLRLAPERAKAPFTRKDLEGLTAEQLRTLVEEGINAARRAGMLEAEGLVSKHRGLIGETDLELLRGVVGNYQARIKVLELDQNKRQEQRRATVRLDARPLLDKLAPVTATELNGEHGDKQSEDSALEGYGLFDLRVQQAAAKAKIPPTLKNGESVHVPGDGMYMYDISRDGDMYSCTCPSWQYNKAPNDRRTCKHLRRYRGKEVEEKRIARPQPSCWCGVLLVRGQCQVHTTRWTGDERCECGRRLDFCKEELRDGRALRGLHHVPRIATA